jgi:hypothetical protein
MGLHGVSSMAQDSQACTPSRVAEVSAEIALGEEYFTLKSILEPRPLRRYHYLSFSYLRPRHVAHPPLAPSWLAAFRRSLA